MRLMIAAFLFAAAAPAPAEELARRTLPDDFHYDGSGKIKVAFFDADSTLRVAPSGGVSAGGKRDVWILPNVSGEIARLNREGYLVVIVSNQGGVPKRVSLQDADGALDFTRKMIRWLDAEARIHYFDFAELYDRDRKPDTGMMERLEAMLIAKYGAAIDRKESFMCGDAARKGIDLSDSDRKVADNFGIPFKDPADFFHWRRYGYERFTKKSQIDEFYEKNPQLKKPVSGPCPFPSLLPPRKTD